MSWCCLERSDDIESVSKSRDKGLATLHFAWVLHGRTLAVGSYHGNNYCLERPCRSAVVLDGVLVLLNRGEEQLAILRRRARTLQHSRLPWTAREQVDRGCDGRPTATGRRIWA